LLEPQKETDRVYKWLTSDKRHLKKNCKRKPPYDWSDIVEKSKDEAMARIAQSDDPHTSYYWKLATPTEDCPNWIARWFLYHKFRYRDGRNRNPTRGEDGGHTYGSSSSHSPCYHQKHGNGVEESNGYYDSQDPCYAVDSTAAGVYFSCFDMTSDHAIHIGSQLASSMNTTGTRHHAQHLIYEPNFDRIESDCQQVKITRGTIILQQVRAPPQTLN
jgi:hypothetical protein